MSGQCKAQRDHTGQMVCVPCGLQWDADDPDPPECAAGHVVTKPGVTEQLAASKAKPETGKRAVKIILEDLKK